MPRKPLPDSPEILGRVLAECAEFIRWYDPFRHQFWALEKALPAEQLDSAAAPLMETEPNCLVVSVEYLDLPFKTDAGGLVSPQALVDWWFNSGLRRVDYTFLHGDAVLALYREAKARLEARGKPKPKAKPKAKPTRLRSKAETERGKFAYERMMEAELTLKEIQALINAHAHQGWRKATSEKAVRIAAETYARENHKAEPPSRRKSH